MRPLARPPHVSAALSAVVATLALWPATASALDLDDYLVAWNVDAGGAGEGDGVDRAHDLVVTSTEGLLAVGELDGAAAEGHDAYVLQLDNAGAEVWSEVLPGGSTAEAWYALAVEPISGDVALCGTIAGAYHVDVRDPAALGTSRWRAPYSYTDGASSDVQECRDIAWNGLDLAATGWADSGAEEGRWLTFRLDGSDGQIQTAPLGFDAAQFPAVPDVARGLAVNPIDGTLSIVGDVGIAGLDGSDANDTDGRIATHLLLDQSEVWTSPVAGPQLLADSLTDVLVDPADGSVTAVGWVNVGDDNAGGADLDWFLARWESDGTPVWSTTWTSIVGASEGATSVVLDDQGDLLVSGWSIDAVTGNEVFRIARHDDYDGAMLQEWAAPPLAGDARAEQVAYGQGLIGIAGWADDGAGIAFRVTLLDVDDDLDGVANAADGCPSDPEKVEPGVCGCGDPDQDSDADGSLDCEDLCAADPNKTDPGVCGCDEPDTDTDGDETLDCDDECDEDPNKITLGICGCGSPDTDTDGDGVLGCDDACTNTPPGEPVDEFGCPEGEGPVEPTGDTGVTEPPEDEDKGGCGCDAGGAGALPVAPLAALAVLRRRRSYAAKR